MPASQRLRYLGLVTKTHADVVQAILDTRWLPRYEQGAPSATDRG